MTRFKSKLLSLAADRDRHGLKPFKVYSPANADELRIPFKRDKFAKVVGKLAELPPDDATTERIVSGVLVQNGFNLTLMAPEDLKEYAGLTTTTVMFKKRLFCSAGVDLIRWGLEGMFGGIQVLDTPMNGAMNGHGGDGSTTFVIMDCVTVFCDPSGEVVLSWEGNMMNDAIADSVLAVLLQMETGMVGVKRM
jgi:cleavage and polyadenylation specificity factor subunit 3